VERTWIGPKGRRLGVELAPPWWETSRGLVPAQIVPLDHVYRTVPPRLRRVAVLTEPFKPGGGFNYNHYCVIGRARDCLRLALDRLRRRPALMWHKVAQNYLYFTRFTGRQPFDATIGQGGLAWWMRFYEGLLCQDWRPRARLTHVGLTSYWPPSGFMMIFPLIVGAAAVKIKRTWRRDPLRARLALLMLYCVLWVLAMVLLVDGLEGNRMRFSTLSYLLVLFFWVLPGAAAEPMRGKSQKHEPQ
jgi:hypothetical protein